MFLLISGRHVGAHPDGHQHGVSIQISINLGKTFLRISRIWKIASAWILAMVFAYLNPFISLILDFIYWTVLIFILDYFEWRDTANQQFGTDFLHVNGTQNINQGGEQFVIFWIKMSQKFVWAIKISQPHAFILSLILTGLFKVGLRESRISAKFEFRKKRLKSEFSLILLPTIWWLNARKRIEKIYPRNCFWRKEKETRIIFNPGVAR